MTTATRESIAEIVGEFRAVDPAEVLAAIGRAVDDGDRDALTPYGIDCPTGSLAEIAVQASTFLEYLHADGGLR